MELLQRGVWGGEQPYQLYARWQGEQTLDPGQLRLLNTFVERYSQGQLSTPRDSVEVVQAQIARLRAANDQLQDFRTLIDDSLAQMADAVVVADGLAHAHALGVIHRLDLHQTPGGARQGHGGRGA